MCFRKHLAELACLQCRPLTTWEHLEHHKVKNMTKTQDCWAAIILYQTRMGQHSSVPKVQQLLSSVPTSLWSDVKEEEMLQSGKHDPAPTVWDVLLPSNSNITYFSWNYLFSQFKRLICFLCWIDWKICKSDLQQTAFKPFWNWSWLTSVFSPFCCVSWSTFPHQLTSLCALLIWASFPFPPTHSAGTEVDRLPQSRSPQHSSSHVTDPDPLSNSMFSTYS